MSYPRKAYIVGAITVFALGVLSRLVVTGSLFFDKYLGDALYAVLLYLLLRIRRPSPLQREHANLAMVIVFAIELFQLSGIPLAMRQSDNFLLKVLSILLGTKFAWLDVVAYAVGILGAYGIDISFGANSGEIPFGSAQGKLSPSSNWRFWLSRWLR